MTSLSAVVLVPGSADASVASIALPSRRNVAAVRIRHLNDDIDSAIAIGPASFADFAGAKQRTLASPAAVSSALHALAVSRPTRANHVFPDVRWSIALLGVRGEPLVTVYADRFVLEGAVGAFGVKFHDGDALAAWLHAHDPLR